MRVQRGGRPRSPQNRGSLLALVVDSAGHYNALNALQSRIPVAALCFQDLGRYHSHVISHMCGRRPGRTCTAAAVPGVSARWLQMLLCELQFMCWGEEAAEPSLGRSRRAVYV